jgi:hypothetical protein
MTAYVGNNNDKVVSAKIQNPLSSPKGVQIAFSVTAMAIATNIGLLPTNSFPIWRCPDHPGIVSGVPNGLPVYDAGLAQWDIGYQYFGGIANWTPSLGGGAGTYSGHSPIKLSQSQPYWTLAADDVIKNGTAWGAPNGDGSMYNNALFNGLPPHHTSDSLVPQGGNEVFADGSARWCQFETMYELSDWGNGKYCFWYQDSRDFSASLVSALPSLRATNYR